MNELDALLRLALASALGIVGWFLRGTAQELREVRRMANDHEVALARHGVQIEEHGERLSRHDDQIGVVLYRKE